jgi:hypothetical protein
MLTKLSLSTPLSSVFTVAQGHSTGSGILLYLFIIILQTGGKRLTISVKPTMQYRLAGRMPLPLKDEGMPPY